MAFAEEIDEALAELEEDTLAETFTWNGTDYTAFIDGATKGGKLEGFGWGIDMDLVIICRTSIFAGDVPARNDTLTFNGASYRIDKVLTAPQSVFLRLDCVTVDRGA